MNLGSIVNNRPKNRGMWVSLGGFSELCCLFFVFFFFCFFCFVLFFSNMPFSMCLLLLSTFLLHIPVLMFLMQKIFPILRGENSTAYVALDITQTCLYNFDPLLCSKTGVYRGIHYFSYFCSKHVLRVSRQNRLAEQK